ncbi:MAG: type II secretion system protein [Spirochaetes bacterium]|nr:type II secretion system protein [Spirochaetota bacterium]
MKPSPETHESPAWQNGRYMAGGFTLIELMVVVTIFAIIAMVAVPRLSRLFSSRSENMSFLTKYIAKTHDDAFLNARIDFLAIHLHKGETDMDAKDPAGEIFARRNAVSVLNMKEGVYVDSPRALLQPYEFPDSFRIEEVVLRTGEVISEGNVVIPFYPQGYSDNAILHVVTNDDERWSVRIRKHFRDPEVVHEWVQ